MKKIIIKKLNSSKSLFRINNKIFFCQIGRSGIIPSYRKVEGDGSTPMGKFKILKIFYRNDKLKFLNLKKLYNFKVLRITKNCIWHDDPSTKKYNKYEKLTNNSKSYFSHEYLWRNDNVYDLIIALNYNMQPIIPKKGSAIFIHCSFKDKRPTAGCISLDKKDLKFILNNLQTIKYVKI